MQGDKAVIILWFLFVLVVIRGYMGVNVYLALSKKERKSWLCLTKLDRWFLWSAHQIIKDKYSKYEKKKIRYAVIFKVYKGILSILHIELIMSLVFGVLSGMLEYCQRLFSWFGWLYIISVLISFFSLAWIEVFSHWRYHKSRYR